MEVWKDVVGFEQYYEVSNMGNVRSKERIQAFPFDETKIGKKKKKMMKQTPNSKGYYRVSLSDRKKTKQYFVHRLVAQAFVENPQNLPVVNHLDFDYTNNRAENLEWTTSKGNMEYSAKRGRFIHTEEWSMKIKKTLDKWKNILYYLSAVSAIGCLAQLIRASRLHREGRGFESLNTHQKISRRMAEFFLQKILEFSYVRYNNCAHVIF